MPRRNENAGRRRRRVTRHGGDRQAVTYGRYCPECGFSELGVDARLLEAWIDCPRCRFLKRSSGATAPSAA